MPCRVDIDPSYEIIKRANKTEQELTTALALATKELEMFKRLADDATRAACETHHALYKQDPDILEKVLDNSEFVREWFWKHQTDDMNAGRSFFATIGGKLREVNGTFEG